MKAFFTLTILVGILVAVFGAVAPPPSDDQTKMLNECKQQEKASDDDVLQFMNHKIPQGPNAKCFLACVHEKTGIIKGGKVNVDILKAPPMKDGDTVKPASPTSEQALKECVALNHPDRCELSSKLAECLNKAFSGNGNGNDIKKN